MKDDAAMVADWTRSHGVVNDVALWLRDRGKRAFLHPIALRPDACVRHLFRDQGDIAVLMDGACRRVEVKWRKNLTFSGRRSYRYQDGLYVDERYHIDNYSGPDALLAYIVVSADRRCMAIVSADTAPNWFAVSKHDKFQRRTAEWMVCPLDLVKWVRGPLDVSVECAA